MCKNLVLISDGCPGQNKNYTMLHFLYILVHGFNLFESITYMFPVRGHSYLPNDQDFSIIEKKKRKKERIEVPQDWYKLILESRINPSPFRLVKVKGSMIFDIKTSTEKFFLNTPRPAINIKNVRMIRIENQTEFVFLRDTYNGLWRSSKVLSKIKIGREIVMKQAYMGPLPVKSTKLENVDKLLGLLHKQENRKFYDDLIREANKSSSDTVEVDIDNDDNSSGCED